MNSFRKRGHTRCVGARTLITGFSLLIPTVHDAIANNPPCASMDGTWTSPEGKYTLNQDPDGKIKGQFVSTGPTCPSGETYEVHQTSASTGNGQFVIAATDLGNNPKCNSGFVAEPTISGPGCTTAAVSFTTSSGGSGKETWNYSGCRVPDKETTPQFLNWSSAPAITAAVFGQGLIFTESSSGWYDFGGRTITETFPQAGVDSCHFLGSSIPDQSVGVAEESGTLTSAGANPIIYPDTVGPIQSFVTYYRATSRTPCNVTLNQVMVIDCPDGTKPYQPNKLIAFTGDTTVTDLRGPAASPTPSPTLTWGPPPPKDYMTIIINRLFLRPHK
jgi:hypothetical protein